MSSLPEIHDLVPVSPSPARGGLRAFSQGASAMPVNAALAYLAGLHSSASRRTMASKLNVFARWAGYGDLRDCQWSAMRAEHVIAFNAYQEKEGLSAATANCYLAALKGVAKAAWLGNLIDHEVYLRINAIKQRRHYRLPKGRSLSKEESHDLIHDCDLNTPLGARDAAVIMLMLGCGLRRGEIPGLTLAAYNRQAQSLTLIGKGDKERRVFLSTKVARVLNHWIDTYRGAEEGLIFGRIYKNGRLDLSKPLDPSSVGRMTRQRTLHATQEEATAHDLRRTFATRLLDKNVDIVTVKNMMGHANIATTAMYDRRGEKAMQEASELVEI